VQDASGSHHPFAGGLALRCLSSVGPEGDAMLNSWCAAPM
jgi:hypothetical protein